MGHKNSQCFLFKDLVQGAIKEGRLKFAEKPPNENDTDPLRVDAHYAEPAGINMVETSKDFINMSVFGSFTGNISRKTVEGVRKATEVLNKGVTEDSNKRTTAGSYLVAVKDSTEDLEAKMQKMNLAAKSNVEVNMVEVYEAKASEEAIRQEEVNKTSFSKENENLADFLQRCQKKKSEVMLCPR